MGSLRNSESSATRFPNPVKIKVAEPKIQPEEKKIEEPAPKPKKIVPPKPATERIVKQEPTKQAAPIQGVTTESVSDKGSIAVPVGNTLLREDEGKRVNPHDVGDLSSAPKLKFDSVVVPPYTDAAIDAGLEGVFTVDVYVDSTGNVTEVELRKKVGYGMDERILTSARGVKFFPRKNQRGVAEGAWTEIKFNLQLP
jgi:TonB family protein